LSFSGDLYPSVASKVMTTKGDMVDFDTIRQRLAIGSANQILQVKSNLPSWETVDLADTVLTTAGDVLYENATPELARLGAGTQYFNLQMGASLPAWTASSSSTLTTQGDLLIASGANTLSRLARGSDNQVLTMNGTALNWETAGGGATVTTVEQVPASTTTASTSFVDITDSSLTKPTIVGGKCYDSICGCSDSNGANQAWSVGLNVDGSVTTLIGAVTTSGAIEFPTSLHDISDADGTTLKAQLKVNDTGSARFLSASDGDYEALISSFGVG